MRPGYLILSLWLTILPAAGAAFDDTALEQPARALEAQLISPCCWSQPVSMHYSPAAGRMRVEIRRLLSEGMTPEQVREAFVAQYGERILAAPPVRGFFGLSYWLPILALLAGAGVVTVYYRTHRHSPRETPTAQPARIDPGWARRLEAELEE